MSNRSGRVCVFPGTIGSGGATRNMIRLSTALASLGFQVDLFVTSRHTGVVPEVPENVTVVYGGRSVKRSLIPLARYIRARDPIAIISARTYVNIAAWLAVKLSGNPTKVIATERTVATTEQQEDPKLVSRAIAAVRAAVYPHVDSIVAVSGAVAEDLRLSRAEWARDVRVVYNPIVSDELQRLAASEISLPGFGTIPPFSPLLVSVGRLTPAKDQFTLLRAFAMFRQKHPLSGLVILGEGQLRSGLQQEVADLRLDKAVVMPGYCSNPYPLMKRADVFVQSSRWEGLPTVLVEALALGTKVVATDCPGGVAEVLQNGTVGTLTRVGCARSLAEGIEKELATTRDDAMLARAVARFDSDRVAGMYADLIRADRRAKENAGP